MSILNYFERRGSKDSFYPAPTLFQVICHLRYNLQMTVLVISPVNYLSSAGKLVNTIVYSPRKCAPIGHYAAVHAPTRASVYYGKQLAHNVPESTCRKFRDEYRKELKKRAESVAPGETIQETTKLLVQFENFQYHVDPRYLYVYNHRSYRLCIIKHA